MTSPTRIRPPANWDTHDHDRFVVHADSLHRSPLGFALSVAEGLDRRPRRLDASYLYDAAGSDLFDRITAQPEYYLTRAEDRLLTTGAAAIRKTAGPSVLVELGSGTSTKTRRLLDAWTAAGPTTYVPVDVDRHGLEQASRSLCRGYPSLTVEALAAGYERALPLLRGTSPMTVAFLGSSLGNLGWQEYPAFCESVASVLSEGDHFLVGVDLMKKPAAIEAAYNDAAGITAAFTRNLFARMNRELLTDVSLDAIEHVAFFDAARERIEIFAEARREFVIRIPMLAREFPIARRERILTEISYKFRPEGAVASVEQSGFRLVWNSVGDGAFGVFLFRRTSPPNRLLGPRRHARSAFQDAVRLLAETRTRTLDMVAPLTDEDLQRQHSRLMSPITWDMGHIAHFEATWLGRALGMDVASPDGDALYEPLATPRSRRAELALPSVAEVRAYLAAVRQSVEHRLDRFDQVDKFDRLDRLDGLASPAPVQNSVGASPLLEGDLVFNLVAQHEAQHQETILQAIALREDLEYRPSFVSAAVAVPAARPFTESVLVPAGRFVMGTNDRTAAYDNERPAHDVDLPEFRIDRCPITNSQYLAFMEDGGYLRRELWSDAGWNWLQEDGARAPAHWRLPASRDWPKDKTWTRGWEAMVFGRLSPLDPHAPVMHVSWHEADACARWAGGRLPSEAEWEKAALWDPARGESRRNPWGNEDWTSAHANLDQRRLDPAPAAASMAGQSAYGCLQMLGDVWEWTSSWFDGFPGFASFPYKEYSEIFFGKTYRVLRGGSFATRAIVARPTMRNWDLPERRQIFAGFRCVRSIEPHTR